MHFATKDFQVDSQDLAVQFWDCGRSATNSWALPRLFYRSTHVCLYCFDITSEESFNLLPSLIDTAEPYLNEHTIKVMIGCKKDLEANRSDVASAMAASRGCLYFECSSKTAEGIEDMMQSILPRLLNVIPLLDEAFKTDGIFINQGDQTPHDNWPCQC